MAWQRIFRDQCGCITAYRRTRQLGWFLLTVGVQKIVFTRPRPEQDAPLADWLVRGSQALANRLRRGVDNQLPHWRQELSILDLGPRSRTRPCRNLDVWCDLNRSQIRQLLSHLHGLLPAARRVILTGFTELQRRSSQGLLISRFQTATERCFFPSGMLRNLVLR